jgi:hypothetical protein
MTAHYRRTAILEITADTAEEMQAAGNAFAVAAQALGIAMSQTQGLAHVTAPLLAAQVAAHMQPLMSIQLPGVVVQPIPQLLEQKNGDQNRDGNH